MLKDWLHFWRTKDIHNEWPDPRKYRATEEWCPEILEGNSKDTVYKGG